MKAIIFIISLIININLAYAQLPAGVRELITKSPVPLNQISIWVAPVNSETPLISFQENTPRNPASVAKLLTTGTGLINLGADYRWKTEFYIDGKISNNTLNGNLIIKGYGNPYMVEERLVDIVSSLQEKGIYDINGKIIMDNYFFENEVEIPDLFDGNGMSPYNAIPNALAINFRTIKVTFSGNTGKAVVTTNPKLEYSEIQNNMTLNNSKKCKGKGFRPVINADKNQDLIIVSGSISRACSGVMLRKVLGDAGDLYFGLFKQYWTNAGGTISGSWSYGNVEDNYKLIHTQYSKPLSEQIKVMNKRSNNIMTRQLFLTIGAQMSQPPANLEKSRSIVFSTLKALRINTAGIKLDNGAGLSRVTRISAKQLASYLKSISKTNVSQYFKNSLSIAGVDGTLRKRLRNTPLQGNAIGKTGTLKNAKAVAGYLTNINGEKYVFAMLFQGNKATQGRILQDQILEWVYNH